MPVNFPANVNSRLIPDANNKAWDYLGPRTIKGVVYHRMLGPLWGTDAYFSLAPPGGIHTCPEAGTQWNWGGCNGLTDFGVDANSGEILQWNDPTGAEHPGVSPHRAAWASGPLLEGGAYGDGLAFVADHGWDANVVNRDQASIEISGQYDDPISDACIESVAALSAYFADQFGIPWHVYPLVPGKTYNFTRWHDEFCGTAYKPCPGPVVKQRTGEIIDRTIEIMRQHQS